MNFNLLLPLVITVVLAVAGWLAAHRLATARERAAKRRETRVSYLIEAYRRFESVCHRPPLGPAEARLLESALADIQLFGTHSQVLLAHEFVHQYSSQHIAGVDRLLADLRNELRSELGLDAGAEDTFFLRVTFDDDKKGQPCAPPNSRPPSQLPASPVVKSSDSLRTPSSGGCG
jgi:hypothetical protein